MYKVMSSYYGQLSTKENVEAAIAWAEIYKGKAHSDEEIFVWCNGIKLYVAGK